jgi:putative endonuclease
MTDKMYGTLYIGMTNNLERRVYEHKIGVYDGFTKKYNLHMLVWFDSTNDVQSALHYEKKLKKWNRTWKIRLIQEKNPDWKDLSNLFSDQGFPPTRE